jgi:glutathione S-transferase
LIRFYFNLAPNPAKVALMLEELGLPYEAVPVDTAKGEQHAPAFRAINPNGKVPAIIDTEGPGGREARVFDSSAILLYLGEKAGRFVGSPADRPELLSWLFFIATGLGPFSGQAVHFQHAAPEKLPYAVNRYRREVERHYRVLDKQPRIYRRRRLFDRRYVGLGLAPARLESVARRGRRPGRLPKSQAPVRGRRRPAGGGAGESGGQGSFLQERSGRGGEAGDVSVELSRNRDLS